MLNIPTHHQYTFRLPCPKKKVANSQSASYLACQVGSMQPNAPSIFQPNIHGSQFATPKAKQGSLQKLVCDSPDSGYGSQCATPHTVEASEAGLGVAPEVPLPKTPPSARRTSSFSSSKALRSLSFSPQKLRRVPQATPVQKKDGTTTHPPRSVTKSPPKFNRYIPMPEISGAVTERFQTTKGAESLSPYEQITRRERSSLCMPSSPLDQGSTASSIHGFASLADRSSRSVYYFGWVSNMILTLICIDIGRDTVDIFRQPPAVNNNLHLIRQPFPRGILMRMRTAASNPSSRSYFMSLYNPDESDTDDAESYQKHLADALHIDRALKVMNLNSPSTPSRKWRRDSSALQSGDSMRPFRSALLSPLGGHTTAAKRKRRKIEGQSIFVAPIK